MKFSITIPAYKRTYLRECIESVLKQTYKDFELIIVNDASPEDLDSIIKEFQDNRIHYYKNTKNCGAVNVVDNWNICLSYARGDYVICMGDDDKLLPNCLQEYDILIEKFPNRSIYHAWTEIINENSEVTSLQEPRPLQESAYSMIWNRWNNKRIQFIGDFLFERKRLIENNGFFKLPLAWSSDDISTIIAAKDNGIVNSQTPLFQYRINSKRITDTGNPTIKLHAIDLEEKWFWDFLINNKTSNLQDSIYRSCILQNFKKHFTKKRIRTLALDIKDKGYYRFIYWLIHKNIHSLSFKELAYTFIEAYKSKEAPKNY